MAQTLENDPVQVDRRQAEDRRQAGSDRRQQDVPVEVDRRQGDRRKTQRRRQIDPTTCERDYTNDEIEFMQALDAYKRENGRMFPTCSEILEVIRSLGYVRLTIDDEQDDNFEAASKTNVLAESEDDFDESFEDLDDE